MKLTSRLQSTAGASRTRASNCTEQLEPFGMVIFGTMLQVFCIARRGRVFVEAREMFLYITFEYPTLHEMLPLPQVTQR
jgi:hypothetical protein